MTFTLDLTDLVAEIKAELKAEIVAELRADQDTRSVPEWMGVKDAAAYAGITEGRVRKLIARRVLPVSQEAKGCRVFIARSDVDRHLEGFRTNTHE